MKKASNFPCGTFYATPAKRTFRLRQATKQRKPGRRWKLHYERIDTETQGDNFILIFWANTRIINLDYEGELLLFFAAVQLIPSYGGGLAVTSQVFKGEKLCLPESQKEILTYNFNILGARKLKEIKYSRAINNY